MTLPSHKGREGKKAKQGFVPFFAGGERIDRVNLVRRREG